MAYVRSKAPVEYDAGWVDRELERVGQAMGEFGVLRLAETNVEPLKPRTGDVRLADGSNWDPGSGAGFYGYYAGAWHKLG